MKKGQITIDLLITLIVVILVAGTMMYFYNNYKENQDKMMLENQLRIYANDLAGKITLAQTMSDMNFNTKIALTKVQYKGDLFYPAITIDNTPKKITIREDKSPYSLSVDANYYSGIKTTATIQNDFLVIKNE